MQQRVLQLIDHHAALESLLVYYSLFVFAYPFN